MQAPPLPTLSLSVEILQGLNLSKRTTTVPDLDSRDEDVCLRAVLEASHVVVRRCLELRVLDVVAFGLYDTQISNIILALMGKSRTHG